MVGCGGGGWRGTTLSAELDERKMFEAAAAAVKEQVRHIDRASTAGQEQENATLTGGA